MPVEAVHTRTRTSLLKPTAVNSVLAEVRAVQAEGREIVSLMRGEPDFSTAEHIVEAAIRALRSGRTRYPDNRGEPALREAVAQKLSRENALTYDAGSEILITDGATLGIHAALMALLNPGDEILLPEPIYDAYQSPVALAGAVARPVKSVCRLDRFLLPVEGLERAATPKTRALLLNTPWNPVGTVFTREELQAIGDFVRRRNLILISDEIYEWITYGDHRHVSPAAASPELRERCVLVNSLSKTYAMTGWRLGYCAAPADILRDMFLVLQQSSRGPATFVQDAGIAALTGPQDCVQNMRIVYSERRQLLLDAFAGASAADALPPEGGFFAMLRLRTAQRDSNEVRRRLLREHGVAVLHGSAYGAAAEGMLRVSFARGGASFEQGLQVLRDGLAAL